MQYEMAQINDYFHLTCIRANSSEICSKDDLKIDSKPNRLKKISSFSVNCKITKSPFLFDKPRL